MIEQHKIDGGGDTPEALPPMPCEHPVYEQDIASADGLCALCLQRELADAKAKIAELETRLACARAELAEEAAKEFEHFGGFKDGYSCAAIIRELAAAPPNYVCVPVEPTENMLNAYTGWFSDKHYTMSTRERSAAIYKAMLAAARKQP